MRTYYKKREGHYGEPFSSSCLSRAPESWVVPIISKKAVADIIEAGEEGWWRRKEEAGASGY